MARQTLDSFTHKPRGGEGWTGGSSDNVSLGSRVWITASNPVKWHDEMVGGFMGWCMYVYM